MKSAFLLLTLFSLPAFSDETIKACMKGPTKDADLIQLNLQFGEQNGSISFSALKAKAIQEKTEDKLTLVDNEKIDDNILDKQIMYALYNIGMKEIDTGINSDTITEKDVQLINFKRAGTSDKKVFLYVVIAGKAVFVGDTNGYQFFTGSTDCSNL